MTVKILRPNWIKLVFLAEWLLFLLILFLQGGLKTERQALIAIGPAIFFYIVAAVLEGVSPSVRQIARGWRILFLAVGLALLDQGIKLLVTIFIPFRTAKPIIPGWFNVAHSCNFRGSWVFSQLDVPTAHLIFLSAAAFFMLCCSWFWYRYYIARQRNSLWADVAFLGLFAGLASWLIEMTLRGHIVDFLCLPNVVTADLKDIYLTIGIAAIFVETIDNPGLSRSWQGWREERANLGRLFKNVVTFSWQDIQGGWQKIWQKNK